MKNKNMARVRASLALLALCGFSTFGVSTAMAVTAVSGTEQNSGSSIAWDSGAAVH